MCTAAVIQNEASDHIVIIINWVKSAMTNKFKQFIYKLKRRNVESKNILLIRFEKYLLLSNFPDMKVALLSFYTYFFNFVLAGTKLAWVTVNTQNKFLCHMCERNFSATENEGRRKEGKASCINFICELSART